MSKDFILTVLLTVYVVQMEEAWESDALWCHGTNPGQTKSHVNSCEGPAVHWILFWTSSCNSLHESSWTASCASGLHVFQWRGEQLLQHFDWWRFRVSWQRNFSQPVKTKFSNFVQYVICSSCLSAWTHLPHKAVHSNYVTSPSWWVCHSAWNEMFLMDRCESRDQPTCPMLSVWWHDQSECQNGQLHGC